MAKRNTEHINMSEALGEFIQENNLSKGINQVNVKDAWYQIMGNAIAKYTTSVHFKNGTLYIQLSSSVLREELSYGNNKIIKNLNEELGEDLILKLVLN
jgi:predicted nucleic acid-binding Zn ribbon protein